MECVKMTSVGDGCVLFKVSKISWKCFSVRLVLFYKVACGGYLLNRFASQNANIYLNRDIQISDQD